MATRTARFADIVELIDQLPLDQRQALVEVVRRRISEDERRRVIASVRAARREHRQGKSREVTPKELMAEILS